MKISYSRGETTPSFFQRNFRCFLISSRFISQCLKTRDLKGTPTQVHPQVAGEAASYGSCRQTVLKVVMATERLCRKRHSWVLRLLENSQPYLKRTAPSSHNCVTFGTIAWPVMKPAFSCTKAGSRRSFWARGAPKEMEERGAREFPTGQASVSPQLMHCTLGRKKARAAPTAAATQPRLSPPGRPTQCPLLGNNAGPFPLIMKYSRQQMTKQFSYSKTQNKNTTWAKVSTGHTPGAAGGLPVYNGGLQQGEGSAAGGGQKCRSSQPAPSIGAWSTPDPCPGIQQGRGHPHKTDPPHWRPNLQSPLPRGPNWMPAESKGNRTYMAEPTSPSWGAFSIRP